MSSGHCPKPGYLLCLNNASTRMHLSLFPIHYLYTGRYIIVSMSSETCVMKLSLIFSIPKLGCTIYNSFHLNFPQGCLPPFTWRWCWSLQCWWGPWSVQASRTSKLLPRTGVVRTLFFHIILAHKRCSHQVFCCSFISTNPPTFCHFHHHVLGFKSFIFYTVLPSYWITTEKVPTETTLPDWTFYSARFPNISIHPKVSSDGGFPEASKS